MKKLLQLSKTLLVMAMLCVGTNVSWAESLSPTQTTELKTTGSKTTSENSGRATTVYYNPDATSWLTTQSSINNKAFSNGLSSYDGSYIVITKFDASSVVSGKTLVSATFTFNSVCTVATKNSNVKVALIGTGWDATTATWSNTNTAAIMNATEIHSGTNVGTTKQQLSIDVKDYLNADDDKVIGFAIYTYTAREQQITDLTLEISAVEESSATTYTIEKYEVGGGLLSSQSGIDGVVGNTASAESEEGTFYSADGSKKYVFDSDNESNVISKALVADTEDNVLKLYFNAYDKYTATVSSICGENMVADITGSWYGDETPVTLYWPKVVSCSDGYYVVDANAADPLYGYTFSTSDLTKMVTYSLDETIVYYSEYESLCGDTYTANYFVDKSSKGYSKALTGSNVMTTAMGLTSAGYYDIEMAGGNRDSGHTTTMNLKLKASDETISESNVISQYFGGSAWNGNMTASKVLIPAGSELYVANDNGEGNAKFAGDYIIVRKSTVSATISSSGYTSLSSAYALDFSGVKDLTAFVVTKATSDGVTLSSVEEAPAETGLVLKGTAGETYSIPVVAYASNPATNLLSAVLEDKTVENDEAYILKGGKFCLLTGATDEAARTIPAGKAYLPAVNVTTGKGALTFAFEDEAATGIVNANADENRNADGYYNLAGQRVSQPVKGLYIKDGKKYIVK